MARAILFAVVDDPDTLAEVKRDMEDRYSQDWEVVTASSGEEALDNLRRLHAEGRSLALLIADEEVGEPWLNEAAELFPESKRVLLTTYAHTDSAIQAINSAQADYYLLKPWISSEEKVFPTLDDLLASWSADNPSTETCARIYGPRWDPRTHELKNFLGQNGIPYEWIDAEDAPNEVEGCRREDFPLLELPNGKILFSPKRDHVAEELGLQTQPAQRFYDLVIIGAGPAGLAAGVYGASEGLETVIIEREAPGGQAGMSSKIENYLGFPAGLSGTDLARRAATQAKKFGVEFLVPQEVVEIKADRHYRTVVLKDGQRVRCHSILLAMGVSYRRLNVPGEESLFNKGVYYGAALSEAISCTDEHVVIVGGANSAGQAALYFSKHAGKVTMLVRAPSLDDEMSQYLIDQVRSVANIEVLTETEVGEICGDEKLESVRVVSKGKNRWLEASAIFLFIGAEPRAEWLGDQICRDKHGFVLSGKDVLKHCQWTLPRPPMLLETSVPGIFVAGDVRAGSVKRVANSVGEGSIAVHMVHEYLREVKA